MAQTLVSVTIPAGHRKLLFEKPHLLRRIFISIRALANDTAWHQSRVSFDDSQFHTYFVLDGPGKYFEARGEGISQGDVWVYNASDIDLFYTATEILV